MAYKQKGWSAFTQKTRKGKQHGPINKQNEPLMPGEHEGTWIYGRGYKGGENEFHEMERARNNPKLGNKFVKSERIADYEDRAEALYNNDLWDAQHTIDNAKGIFKGVKKKKATKKKKQLTSTINKLQREADILRDSSFKKKQLDDKGEYYPQSQRWGVDQPRKAHQLEPYALGKDNWYEPISRVISDSDKPQTVKDREISSHIGPRQATKSGKRPQTWMRKEYEPQTKKKKKK